jgi:hypothetical protein
MSIVEKIAIIWLVLIVLLIWLGHLRQKARHHRLCDHSAYLQPIYPIHLTRGVWSILNVAAAALFIGHFIVARPQLTAPETIADR